MAKKIIKFLDLKKINSSFESDFKSSFNSFLEGGWYVLGQNVKEFESEFSHFCGVKHCIGVNSGLDALILPLMAHIELGILKPGDEVLVPANTFIATLLAVSQVGLKPVLVKPNLETMNIDLEGIKAAITKKTKAIIPVHLYGRICPMKEISEFAETERLIVLEDSAQAHGAEVFGRKAGNWGHASGFSFYPGKNLGALGDGGAVTTNNDELAEMIRAIRNYGTKVKYEHEVVGVNSRLDELQAAFLRIKLKSYETEVTRRREIAGLYFSDVENKHVHLLKKEEVLTENVYHLFVVRTLERDKFRAYLLEKGIETLIHYPKLVYQQKFYDWIEYQDNNLEQAVNELVSLPMGSHLSNEDVAYITSVIKEYRP